MKLAIGITRSRHRGAGAGSPKCLELSVATIANDFAGIGKNTGDLEMKSQTKESSLA